MFRMETQMIVDEGANEKIAMIVSIVHSGLDSKQWVVFGSVHKVLDQQLFFKKVVC